MFKLLKTEDKARRGEFTCPHGTVQTPVFMNVGTQAAIKGALSAEDLEHIGTQVELSNTYHLHLRPGDEVVKKMGGLHKFMTWNGPILTDSGGFQVFSLAGLRKIKEEGVTFASHLDGHRIFMGPEESMRIQSNLGSDIAMAFDECVENPATYPYAKASCERTARWLARCKQALAKYNAEPDAVNPGQQLWGINQGATFKDLRIWHMQEIAKLDLPGYAIGGLAVGEPTEVMYDIIDAVEPYMPKDKPRYLMGVGTPSNIIESVARGIDFFDCVMPARNARHGKLFTWQGAMNMKNAKYTYDDSPIDPQCDCPVCRRYSRAYIRHLFKAEEMLAMRLSVMHSKLTVLSVARHFCSAKVLARGSCRLTTIKTKQKIPAGGRREFLSYFFAFFSLRAAAASALFFAASFSAVLLVEIANFANSTRTRSALVSMTMESSLTETTSPMMPPMVVMLSPTLIASRIACASFLRLFSGRIMKK